MVRVRWGALAPKDVEDARERLIDAAEEAFRKYGVAKTTIADVAAKASVSRATVYRHFTGRDELLIGVVAREAGRFAAALRERMANSASVRHSIVESVLRVVRDARGSEMLRVLLATPAAGVSLSARDGFTNALPIAQQLWRPLLDEARAAGELREGLNLDEAAEWIMRVVISLLATDGRAGRTDEELRAYLTAFLPPALFAAPPEVQLAE